MAGAVSPVDALDAVVIGGGIAGISTLYHLARRGARAVLVEREPELGTQSTGRSAASLAPGYGGPLSDELTAASLDAFRTGVDGFARHPLLTPRPVLWVHPADSVSTAPALPGALDIDVDQAVELCPPLRPGTISGASFQQDGHDIDVEELLRAFERGARHHGGVIRRGATELRLDRVESGWVAHIGDDPAVRARTVVDAAGAWADPVAVAAGLAPAGLRPLKRTAFVAPVPVDTTSLPLVLAADHSFYFKPDVPGVVLCSPADETPVAPCDPGPDEIDVARAIDRINAHTTLGIRSVRRAWAGLRVFTSDRHPLVAPHRDDDTFVWCAGLGGTGVQMSPAVGARAARLVEAACA